VQPDNRIKHVQHMYIMDSSKSFSRGIEALSDI